MNIPKPIYIKEKVLMAKLAGVFKLSVIREICLLTKIVKTR